MRRDMKRRRLYETLSYSRAQPCSSLRIKLLAYCQDRSPQERLSKEINLFSFAEVSLMYQSEQADGNPTLSSRT